MQSLKFYLGSLRSMYDSVHPVFIHHEAFLHWSVNCVFTWLLCNAGTIWGPRIQRELQCCSLTPPVLTVQWDVQRKAHKTTKLQSMGLERWTSGLEHYGSCRGPGFSSQHPYGGWQLLVDTVAGNLMPSSNLCTRHTRGAHAYVLVGKTLVKYKDMRYYCTTQQWLRDSLVRKNSQLKLEK